MKAKNVFFPIILFIMTIQSVGQTNPNCSRNAMFGDIKICLPKIQGMIECYTESEIKPVADGMNHPGNSILGLYFTKANYDKITELDNLDNYIQVFATNKMKNKQIDNSILDDGLNSITGSYLKENWERLSTRIEEKSNGLTLGQPVVVETYGLTNNSKTAIMLSPIADGTDQVFMLISMNLINIKGRLIYFSYYLSYDNKETIKKLKSKNDYFIMSLNENN